MWYEPFTREEQAAWDGLIGRDTQPLDFWTSAKQEGATSLDDAIERLGGKRRLSARQMNLLNEYLHKAVVEIATMHIHRPEFDLWWKRAQHEKAEGRVPPVIMGLGLLDTRSSRFVWVTRQDAEQIITWASGLEGWTDLDNPVEVLDMMVRQF